jgi:glycosyltransferase involved in cell wall biosynthesis
MKILIVNTRHHQGGGDSTYAFNLAELLRGKGHEIAFFAMQDKRNISDFNEDLFVNYIDFEELNRRKGLANGLKVLKRVVYSLEAKKRFARLIDRFNPDIVHLQNIHAHITPSIIYEAKRHAIPVVWTLHDYRLVCPNSHYLIDATAQVCEACGRGNYYQAVLKRCKKGSLLASGMAAFEAYAHRLMQVSNYVDYFLCPSSFLEKRIAARGSVAGKTIHLPLFLPDDLFVQKDNDQGYLLFLGKLADIKGIRPLLRASRLAPAVRLVIAGGAPEPLAGQLPDLLPAHAEYVGLKNRHEVQKLLLKARALVVPSIWFENQPFAIIEAFAASTPVIGSDLGGMTELVKDGERGLLVPPGDVEALAQAMQWMAENPGRAKTMGQAAQIYARSVHSASQHYRHLREIYETALTGLPWKGKFA